MRLLRIRIFVFELSPSSRSRGFAVTCALSEFRCCQNGQSQACQTVLVFPGTGTELTPPVRGRCSAARSVQCSIPPSYLSCVPYPAQKQMPLVSRHTVLLEFIFSLHTVTFGSISLSDSTLMDGRTTQWSKGDTSSYRDPYLRRLRVRGKRGHPPSAQPSDPVTATLRVTR